MMQAWPAPAWRPAAAAAACRPAPPCACRCEGTVLHAACQPTLAWAHCRRAGSAHAHARPRRCLHRLRARPAATAALATLLARRRTLLSPAAAAPGARTRTASASSPASWAGSRPPTSRQARGSWVGVGTCLALPLASLVPIAAEGSKRWNVAAGPACGKHQPQAAAKHTHAGRRPGASAAPRWAAVADRLPRRPPPCYRAAGPRLWRRVPVWRLPRVHA